MEAHLGVALARRTTRNMSLTAKGKRLRTAMAAALVDFALSPDG
jgi:DNA-binding transcriptional LysR family regulator